MFTATRNYPKIGTRTLIYRVVFKKMTHIIQMKTITQCKIKQFDLNYVKTHKKGEKVIC